MMRRLTGWLILCVAIGAMSPLRAAPDYHFKLPGPAPAVSLGPAVLSDTERQFIKGLPEIRVALQQVGAPPYETVAPDGEIVGFQAETLGYLASTLGLRLKPIVFADWPSVLDAVRSGNADMVLTLAVTPDRLRYLEFTLGTVPVPVGVLGLAHNTTPMNAARIALEREYYSNDLVRRQYPDATIVPTGTTVEALREVAEGRADYYVGSLLGAIATLSADPLPGIEVREILQTGAGHYHFGIRKDWAPLAGILNKGITHFRADIEPRAMGTLSAIGSTIATTSTAASGASGASGATATEPASRIAMPASFPLTDADARLLAPRSVWRIGAVRGLAMLNDVDARGAHSGIAAEYAEHVARRLGVVLDVVSFDTVATMLDGLRAGRIDFIPFLTRTPEREREFAFSKPYFEMPYVLVARSDAPLYWDLGSLRGKRLALSLQHPLREVVAQRYPGIQVIDTRDGTEALDQVGRGLADAAVEIKIFANLRINADPAARLRSVGAVSELPAQFGFAAAREMAPLLPLIDRALADVSPAERERMLRRWVAIDLDPPFPWRRHLPTLLVAAAALLLLAGGTAWWMRRMALEVQARRRADEQLDDIGRTLPGVAFRHVLDPLGRPRRTFFSSGVASFLGVQPGRDQTLVDVLGPGLRPEHGEAARALAASCLRSGEPFKLTVAYRAPDAAPDAASNAASNAAEQWLHIEAVCSRRQDGDSVWTGYVVDVSAEHRLQDRLAREAEARHVLLASASHELRAPAHTLSLALQAIPEAGVPEASARSLRIAREAVRTLGQLLDDVLDVARFQAGRMELRPQDFDLHALVRQLRDAHADALAAKHLGFECSVAPEVPQMVFLDPLRLKQVLTNLLSNAVKYTAAGKVALRVSAGASGVSASAPGAPGAPGARGPVPVLNFTVEDSGAGIPAALLPRLFEPFGSTSVARGSTGLGLSICRRLVDQMGGTIDLQSEPGHGTTVHVVVPASARAPHAAPLRSEGLALVCDDDPVCRMLMAEALSRDGHRVVEVTDGHEALARWRHGDIRVLITDLTMPGLGGLALISAIRAEESGRPERTAIIVCSGSLALPLESSGEVQHHDAFLAKPLDLRMLSDVLAQLGVRGRVPTTV